MRKKNMSLLLFFVVFLFVFIFGCTKKQIADYSFWGNGVDTLNKSTTAEFWQKTRSRSSLVDAYKRLGGFYQKQGKHREAIGEFIKAIRAKTDDAKVYNSLAMSYDALKEYNFSEMAYKDAIALAPEQQYLYNNYGCSSLLRGDIDLAVALFEKAASLDPKSPRINNNLTLAVQRHNKKEEFDGGEQEITQAPQLYIAGNMLADEGEPVIEIGNSEKVAPVMPDIAAEAIQVEIVSSPIIENIDGTVIIENAPVPVGVDNSKEVSSIAATTDDEGHWYNGLIDFALASLGFVSDEPVVADTAVIEFETQEIPEQSEQQVVTGRVAHNISVESVELTEAIAITRGSKDHGAELPSLEGVENIPKEREVAETVAVSTVEVSEATIVATISETNNEIVETVSNEDDVIAEDVIAAVNTAKTVPDSTKKDMTVTAEANEVPEVVNEIIADTKPDKVILIEAMLFADSIGDDIPPKSSTPKIELIVPALRKIIYAKKKVAAVTNTGQDVQNNQKVAIEVSNGNGVEGMAIRSAAYFREQGRYVRRITNAVHFGFKDTIVFYREGYLQEAYEIALMVPGLQELKLVESLGRPEILVRLLLGKDVATLGFPEFMAGISHQQISKYDQTVTMAGYPD